MDDLSPPRLSPAEVVHAYHERTKHSLKAYAAGPGTLDWDAQPDPFRTFDGAPRISLPLPAMELTASFGDLFRPGQVPELPFSLPAIGTLLRHAFGLAAWKELGPDRWALRCNPSSGNLHPTEVYLIARGLPDLEDGLYHYLPLAHALEQRCRYGPAELDRDQSGLWIGLTSIHWREAWKYGERAFRYCLLDTGHALGALGYAAAALGWQAKVLAPLSASRLESLLGTDRKEDFGAAEAEEPEALIAITPQQTEHVIADAPGLPDQETAQWAGRAKILDRHPMYRWPIIDEAAEATRATGMAAGAAETHFAACPQPDTDTEISAMPSGALFLQRRSAQRFDARTLMPREIFFEILDGLLPRTGSVFHMLGTPARLHPVIFVIRIEGLEPGVYCLPRHADTGDKLQSLLDPAFTWQKAEDAPSHLPLYRLAAGDKRPIARMISCGQWIASDGCFSLGMLAEYRNAIDANPHQYRRLHFEAGLLGHALYLEAEAAGFRGTGIGCFFDDDFHRALGLSDTTFQSLYHFTVGFPKPDSRIATLPPYPSGDPVEPVTPAVPEDRP